MFDEVPVGPRIGSGADNFFQSDSDLATQARRAEKRENKAGDPIECTSKVLCLLLPEKTESEYAYIGESGFVAKKINLSTGKTSKIFKGHTGPVTCIGLWYKDGEEYLITGSWDKTIVKWDTKTKESIHTFTAHTDFVKSLAISHSSSILCSGSSDRYISSWNLVTGEKLQVFKGHSRGIEDLAFDETETFLFSASSDRHIRKWNASTGECLQVFEGHLTSVYSLKIFDDEMWTASADKTVKRWDLENGKPDTTFTHPDVVKCLVVAGPYLITGSRDEMIRIFEIGSGKMINEFEGHFDEVSCMAVRGTTLYTGSLDCTLRKWSIAAKDLKKSVDKTEAKKSVPSKKETISSKLTEEEERILAELMASDED
ncbi:12128_t:CDS:2 [Funneliformis caledonium]|uniref:12128_t:CDS:1 n=1 Tax=Funneliformis caledonium TaxID=1117310 RepID=A0A9N9AP51_9GLOM|nr:12128_t:CDS:2 [Funneliformis caledonium]